jgi:trk system potassium uptake protein TrkA
MYGDGTSLEVLKKVGANRADVLVSATGEDEDNLVICQMVKIVFITPKTIARVNNPKNEEIFSSFGIDATVSATRIINALIEEQVKADSVVPLLTIHGGDLEIVEVELSSLSPLINKKIRDIKLPEEAIFISIIRNDKVIVPRGDTEFMEEDKVIALVKKEKEHELRNIL